MSNNHCVYCGQRMLFGVENSPLSKSHEHLIPNVAVSQKRNNSESDFFACRECNSKKSKLDEIFGKSSKLMSKHTDIQINTIEKELTKGTKSSFYKSINNFKTNGLFKLPFNYDDLECYANFLAKGLFFIQHNKILNLKKNVIITRFLSKTEMLSLEAFYNTERKSMFDDLSKNKNIININNQCYAIIGSKQEYILILNEYMTFIIKVATKNMSNVGKSIRARTELKSRFVKQYD